MRRLVVLMTVVALIMVMLAMSVAPAFAVGPSPERCEQLIINAIVRQHPAPPVCLP
jgi:hypothetical protein